MALYIHWSLIFPKHTPLATFMARILCGFQPYISHRSFHTLVTHQEEQAEKQSKVLVNRLVLNVAVKQQHTTQVFGLDNKVN